MRRPSVQVLALYDKDGSNAHGLLHKSVLSLRHRLLIQANRFDVLRNNDGKRCHLAPVYSLDNGAASTLVQHKWHHPLRPLAQHGLLAPRFLLLHRDASYERDSARRNPRARSCPAGMEPCGLGTRRRRQQRDGDGRTRWTPGVVEVAAQHCGSACVGATARRR
jgi:hypothetical protein